VYLKVKVDFKELIEFLEQGENRGALTIKLKLPNGQLDWASHRGFPTPWRAFCYFSKLEHISKNTFLNRLFGGYHLTHESLETIHKIDSGTAAFLLVKRTVLKHLGGFDPDYFFYGEDLDLCYRINMLGYSVWYYPKYSAVHLKYQSSKKSGNKQTQSKTRKMFYQTMLTFYNKHYQKKYPRVLGGAVALGVKLLAWKDKDAR
jgi:GT2 family glycosyltransferase